MVKVPLIVSNYQMQFLLDLEPMQRSKLLWFVNFISNQLPSCKKTPCSMTLKMYQPFIGVLKFLGFKLPFIIKVFKYSIIGVDSL